MPKHSELPKMAVALMLILCLLMGGIPLSFSESLNDVQVLSAPLTTRSSATNGMVRVYLSSLGNPSTLDLTIMGNYSVSITGEYLSSGSNVTVGFNSSTGAITLTRNGVKTNMGTGFSLRRHSASGANGIKIKQARESGNPYPGDLSFKAVASGSGYTLYTIAHVYIENYLYGVLPYEMGNSTSIEALKAQAVAARTYTVRMMKDRASGLYDVKDTTSDQVYRGTPSGNANCVAAVDATKGIVLMYGSSYITTYYSASNGGQTEAARSGTSYAYMKVKDDPFDYANPNSTVKKKTVYADLTGSMNSPQLISLLKSKAITKLNQSGYNATQANTTLQTLKSVTPHTPKYASPSRLYTKMDFAMTVRTQNGSGSTVTTTATVTCGIFSELESMLSMGIQSSSNELWSVSKSGSNFVLEARRYGHGMGMSQRGAMYMAKLGYRYDQILGFYYDGCKRVQHSFTNSILSADSTDQQITVEPPADIDDEDEGACTGTVTLISAKSSLAIRGEKSLTGQVIGSAGNGALVSVLANDGTWCFIRFGELKGYVPANALVISGTPAGSEETSTSIIGFSTVTASDFVNLRSEPSMSGSVVGTAPSGAVLSVFSLSGSWARVQYNATVAYANTGFISGVSSSYPEQTVSSGSATATIVTEDGTDVVNLRASASTDAQVLSQLAHGTQVTVTADDGSWCVVSYQGMTGYIQSDYLTYGSGTLEPNVTPDDPSTDDEPQDKPSVTTAVVTTENGSLNLRAEAMAGSSILTTIPRGATVEITQVGDIWCGVRYNGVSGYAMRMYLTLSGGSIAPPDAGTSGDTAVVTTQSGSLNLRAQARSGSEILARIPQYATISVIQRGDEWCNVSWNGITGYVMTVFLTFNDSQTPDKDGDTPDTDGDGTDDDTPDTDDDGTEGDTPDTAGGTPAPSPAPDVNDPDEPIVTPLPDTEDTVYAVVSTASGSLNLRRDALPGSPVLARIPKGTTIRVEERLSAWSKTSYAGQTGFVMNAYLNFLEGMPDSSSGETAVVTTASGSLNLRMEPSRNAGVIARIPQYATVNVEQRGGTWCAVGYSGLFGYVMTEYLTFNSDGSGTTTPDAGSSESGTGGDGEENNGNDTGSDGDTNAETTVLTAYVTTASGSLNLRDQPDAYAGILTTIPRNAAVTVDQKGATWCRVRYMGYSGYAMTQFLRFASTTEQTSPDESQTTNGTDAPDSSAGDSSTGTQPTTSYAWVLTASGSLNLRQAPQSYAGLITTIPRLSRVEVLSVDGSWSYVRYQGVVGYAMSQYLTATDPNQGAGQPSDGGSTPDTAEPAPDTTEPTPDNGEASDDGSSQDGAAPSPDAPDHSVSKEPSDNMANGSRLDITLEAPDSALFADIQPLSGRNEVILYQLCTDESGQVAAAQAGERVEIVLKGDTWCLVAYQSVQGYCLTKELSVVSP